jgi:hypothetical protein
MDEFIKKNPKLNDDILVNEIIEGTMINLFYDKRIQSWEIATKNAIGGNYWFYRNQYSFEKYKNVQQPTFRQMFLEAFCANENEDINDLAFIDYLSKDYSYSFVLQHPMNHIVQTITRAVVYLVAVYHIFDDRIVSIPPNVFEEWDCFLDIRGLIEFPKRFEEESYEEIKQSFNSFNSLGIMFYNLNTGERASIENNIYTMVKELRGNNPNLQYHYLTLKNAGKVDEFLNIFPQYKDLFYEFYIQYNNFIKNIHKSYVSYYVEKNGVRVSKKYFPLVYKIHHEVFLTSLTTDNKRIIRKEVVYDFINNIHPKQLIFYLNNKE